MESFVKTEGKVCSIVIIAQKKAAFYTYFLMVIEIRKLILPRLRS